MVNMRVSSQLSKENAEIYSGTGSKAIHTVKTFSSKQGKMPKNTVGDVIQSVV